MITSAADSSAAQHLPVRLMSTQQTWGGGEVYLMTLAQGLAKLGADVAFIAPSGSELEKRADAEGFAVWTISGRGRSPWQIYRLRNWLCENRQPAILHCNDSHALSAGGTAAFGLSHVRVVGIRHTMFPIRSIAKYHCLADRVICVSNAVADSCQASGIVADNLRVIHAAIEPPSINDEQVKQIRAELLSSEWQKLIVAVGNLFDCKGHDTLIDAVAQVAKDHNLILAIAGEGPEREQLEHRIARQNLGDRVHLLGFRDDANELMAAADLVAHPAREEGLCLTVAAAMMLGQPVVASAVGGLCDVLGIDQRMACTDGPFSPVLAPDNVSQLAEAIDRILTEPPEHAALVKAKRYALAHFNAKQLAQNTLSLYHELIWPQQAVA